MGEKDFSIVALTDAVRQIQTYSALTNSLPPLLSGQDRVSRTTRRVIAAGPTEPARIVTETLVWLDGDPSGKVVQASQTFVDGLQVKHAIQADGGVWLTNETVIIPGSPKTVSSYAPDGTTTVTTYHTGRLASTTSYAPVLGQVTRVTLGYDPHGRQNTVTDARNGTTTYTYNNADLVESVTTPAPTGLDAPQTTRTYYNTSLQVTNVVHPDMTSTFTSYYPTGLREKTWGSREYSVGYTYDYAGRLKTMTTWQNFSSSTGAAVTTWNYETNRGWLLNKRYQDGNGTDYTYTPAGRLKTRTWDRGVSTSYTNNLAGELERFFYSDGTPGVTNAYNRLGS